MPSIRFSRTAAAMLLLSAGAMAQIGPAGGGASGGGSGVPGPQGPAGNSVLNGTGAPVSSRGSNGDFYLRTDTSCLYGPKASGSWPGSCVSLIGPAGNTLLSGAGAPAASAGNNGDFYLRTDTTCLYGPKTAGAWPGSCQSLIGPAGSGAALSGLTPGAIVAAASSSSVSTPSATATVDSSGNIVATSITSASAGTGNLTMQFGAAPANPASGKALIYADSSTGLLTCHNSSGASCMPAATIPATAVQTNQSNAYTTGTQDFSQSSHLIAKNGTIAAKPANCSVGEVYFATDATPGQNWYFCATANTWTQQVAGGGSAATSLVDSSTNNAVTVTQGAGTPANYINVTNAGAGVSPQLGPAGSDANIGLQLVPKGTGYVYIPTSGFNTGSGSSPFFAIGPISTGGNSYGVLMTLNQPAAAGGNAEYIRMANNGSWQGSLEGGSIFLKNGIAAGASTSGADGAAEVNNSGQFLARDLGYFGIGNGATAGSTDIALARTRAGQFEINNGGSGGAAAANIRDLKLRHTVASGSSPALTSGTGSLAATASDEAGRVTLSAASQTSIVLTFGTTYANAPACVANDETTAILVQAVASPATLTLNGSFGSADNITWRCGGF